MQGIPLRFGVVDKGAIDTAAGHEDNPYVRSDANGFQLPGSMEWECAARYRGTDSTNSIEFSGTYWTKGNSASGAYTYYNDVNDVEPANGIVDGKDADDQVAVYGDYWNGSSWVATGVTSTAAVKSKAANALGIYDMSGNVMEWCFDWHTSGSGRVVRGGGVRSSADGLQVGFVNDSAPQNGALSIGFRLMMTK